MHARPIGVEDACHFDAQAMLAVLFEKESFSTSLAFVVAGAGANWVHIAPIFFALRMHVGIAIDPAGRGLQDFCLHPFGETQHVDCTVHRGLCRLHGIAGSR